MLKAEISRAGNEKEEKKKATTRNYLQEEVYSNVQNGCLESAEKKSNNAYISSDNSTK